MRRFVDHAGCVALTWWLNDASCRSVYRLRTTVCRSGLLENNRPHQRLLVTASKPYCAKLVVTGSSVNPIRGG